MCICYFPYRIFGIDRAAVFGRPSGTRPRVVPIPAINRRATLTCPSGTKNHPKQVLYSYIRDFDA
jgi:hypothetical protein